MVGGSVIYGLGDLVEVGGADRIHRLSLALARTFVDPGPRDLCSFILRCSSSSARLASY